MRCNQIQCATVYYYAILWDQMSISGGKDAFDFGLDGGGVQLLLQEVVVRQQQDQHLGLLLREDDVLLLRHEEQQQLVGQSLAGLGQVGHQDLRDAGDDVGLGLLVVEGEQTHEESRGRTHLQDALRLVQFLLDQVVQLCVVPPYSFPPAQFLPLQQEVECLVEGDDDAFVLVVELHKSDDFLEEAVQQILPALLRDLSEVVAQLLQGELDDTFGDAAGAGAESLEDVVAVVLEGEEGDGERVDVVRQIPEVDQLSLAFLRELSLLDLHLHLDHLRLQVAVDLRLSFPHQLADVLLPEQPLQSSPLRDLEQLPVVVEIFLQK